jgi:hypothetical protein
MLKGLAGWPTRFFAFLWALPTSVEAGNPFYHPPTNLPLWGRLLPLFFGLLILIACVVHELRKKKG